MVGCIKIPLGMEVGLSLADFVLDGDPGTPPQKGVEPQFSAHIYCGQTAAWIKMPLGTAVGLGLRDIVLDGDPALPPLKGHSPQFSANVRCGHMDGWTKMPLGMEVGSAQATLCSMGTQLPPDERAYPPNPIFGPCLWWPNG